MSKCNPRISPRLRITITNKWAPYLQYVFHIHCICYNNYNGLYECLGRSWNTHKRSIWPVFAHDISWHIFWWAACHIHSQLYVSITNNKLMFHLCIYANANDHSQLLHVCIADVSDNICRIGLLVTTRTYRVAQKSKPLSLIIIESY